MRLFPAIDIQGGRAVRLRRGDFQDETVFGNDPIAIAQRWEQEGALQLHVVDLDGAREGRPHNLDYVTRLTQDVRIPVQFGGGVRDALALEAVQAAGVARLVVGTAALDDPEFLQSALEAWGERLVVALDAERGVVKTHGWQEASGRRAIDEADRLAELGIREIIYTDIARDGMLEGVNLQELRDLAYGSSLQVIASGGVTRLDDLRLLRRLEPLGVTGVIVGRALYEGNFTIGEALAALENPE